MNDTPVVTPATFTVAENSAIGTVVGTISVNDPDVGDTRAFTLSGPDAAAFAIDSSGQITVNGSLNFELKPTYMFTVNVTDSGLAVGSATVTVNLTDVTEAGPTITGVYLNSTSWHVNYADILDDGFINGTRLGAKLNGANQLDNQAWVNINQIVLQFSTNVGASLSVSDFVLTSLPGLRADATAGIVSANNFRKLSWQYRTTDTKSID